MTKTTIKYTFITLISLIIMMTIVIYQYKDETFDENQYYYFYEPEQSENF